MRYLGYRFEKWGTGGASGGQEAQMEKSEKGDGSDGADVGDREEKIGGDWEKRMKIFEWLVGSVVAFGRYGDGRNGRKLKGCRKDT